MERAKDSELLATRIAALDERLLATVAGQEAGMVRLMAERGSLISALVDAKPSAATLEAIEARTNQLQEKLLHWRRAAIMELSGIDQHQRYVNEQAPESATRGFDLSA